MRIAMLGLSALIVAAGCDVLVGLNKVDEVPGAGSGEGGSGEGGSGEGGDATTTASGGGGSGSCNGSSECVPAAPGGIYVRTKVGDEPCPAGWAQPQLLYEGVDPGCAGCSCGTPEGGSCTPATVQRFGSNNCSSEAAGVVSVNDGDCIDVSTGASSYAVGATNPAGGSCAPSQGAREELTPMTACLAVGNATGCDAGEVCVPSNDDGFGEVCVLLGGNASCPAGYPTATTVYGDITDARVCDCACSAPSSPTCMGAEITLHSDNACASAALLNIAAGTACTDVGNINNIDSYLVDAGSWQAGACAAQELSSGVVTFQDERTLCCP